MLNAKEYQDPNGIWKVTTEADEEGRRYRTLGVFTGRIDEIAFALAEQAFYSLTFSKVNTTLPVPTKPKQTVSVVLDTDGFVSLTPSERASFFRDLLAGSNITVNEGQFYGSVRLNREIPESVIREAALAKLTEEEKAVLGLA